MRSRIGLRTPRVERRSARSAASPDSGQATAELAVGLPSLFVVVSLVLWVLATAAAQARCAEAAWIGARLAARGETASVVQAWTVRAAPPGAVVALHRGADSVEVLVSVRVGGALDRVTPALEVTARAVAPAEDVGTVGPNAGRLPRAASPPVGS